ncbi:4-diphosphocytidyl-2C-methyl-D-erythritol kinase [Rhodoplanes elegans]|uniref:4-diphosphocytidyl-2C-methyl-D-erythritol kinase n=1 Tax=Rhodoplanes elegans TaxID=29408 RepID=A0A327KAW4_9BRAD|nr:molybdopterin-binding/glycosyltransferase family 2 protein [Rhodoplanes elegans]MBK5959173.1 4-diphosphocytidyl-2C-methyl-D-erythritol kinase [Rhodoplanes elegans]RAI34795.1 4-diphosphocytidyl-2C-methyl-D-erythritol kinase [Rhodoplanes elegans]
MKFGPVPVAEATGAIVVHTVRRGGLVLKKGTVIGAAEAAALEAAGVDEIVVARLQAGDVPEDAAAGAIAAAAAGPGIRVDKAFTGRANLFADAAGVLVVDRDGVDRLNAVDPDITFATLPAYAPVVVGTMVATAKIIPFAVDGAARDAALAISSGLVRVAPYRVKKVAVVSTLLPGLADKVIEKTLRVTAERLAPAGATIVAERKVPHETEAVTQAIASVLADGAELVIVFGASAIADRRDVIPAAVEAAGGHIARFGMPVDPGNLLMIAEVGGRPVLGAPGCARSPKENGFDWVLARLLCGLPVTSEDVAGMGVGGLLMEIVTRPQPREEPSDPAAPPHGTKIAAVVLAAGRSTRMGGPNKLLAEIGGRPLVRIVVDAVLASQAGPIVVVTGHQRDRVRAALANLPVSFVHNPDYAEGLSTSVKAGIAALPEEVDGAIVCLGDMPQVDPDLIDRLIAAFDPEKGALIVIPTVEGKRGNPVVWSRRFFAELGRLTGDIGARNLIATYQEAVAEVPAAAAAATDVDTAEALAAVKAEIEGG